METATQLNTNVAMNTSSQKKETILQRLGELEKEWDLERVQDLNTSLYALHGTLLGKILNKNASSLPFATTALLAQEAGNNWNPPAEMFKSLGYRTKEEIEQEKQTLLSLREELNLDFGFSAAAVA